jgi:pimeloyl-ACP methyl ester carboxylesterase
MPNPSPTHTNWDGVAPRPFKIDVLESDLDDLKTRLARVRWPDQISGEPWEFGTDLAYLQSLCAYWQDRFDWRAQETRLNAFKQFKVSIGGCDLHYVCEQGEGANPRPLLLTHGWPGSFYEYHKLIPRLTHPSQYGGSPDDAFTVVVPSMPGYGFSFRENQPRFGLNEIADSLKTLMVDVLGLHTFFAHGHDWGAFVATRLGYAHAAHVAGIHITLLAIPRRPVTTPSTADEEAFGRQLDHWQREETGYAQIMGTRPQTLAYALTDSPVGLAAWIIEKFHRWGDCKGDLDHHFGRDVLLTNIMIYWLTGAIGSTFWPYYARLHEPWIVPDGASVMVPTAYAEYPREILTPPRSLAEPFYGNIQRWTRMAEGGHFPALECPDELATDVREFFRAFQL